MLVCGGHPVTWWCHSDLRWPPDWFVLATRWLVSVMFWLVEAAQLAGGGCPVACVSQLVARGSHILVFVSRGLPSGGCPVGSRWPPCSLPLCWLLVALRWFWLANWRLVVATCWFVVATRSAGGATQLACVGHLVACVGCVLAGGGRPVACVFP